jgi:hypothetical protein
MIARHAIVSFKSSSEATERLKEKAKDRLGVH